MSLASEIQAAARHIHEARERVDWQRRRVWELEAAGEDPSRARQLLEIFEAVLASEIDALTSLQTNRVRAMAATARLRLKRRLFVRSKQH